MRLRMIIAYDGRPFLGWQSQPGGETVQDRLQAAAAKIAGAGEPLAVHGSGRTDTGVHALGQVAHFDPPEGNRMRPDEWQRALNSHLPPSIRILECAEAADDFHARFSAREKEYHYRIHTADVLPPLLHGLVWHLPGGGGVDPELLAEAFGIFTGSHDFRHFAANRGNESPENPPDTVRTIRFSEMDRPAPDEIRLRVAGSGFLYKMVRLLTGSAVHRARGRESLDWLRGLLEAPDAAAAKSSHCAPAEGLTLVRVGYD